MIAPAQGGGMIHFAAAQGGTSGINRAQGGSTAFSPATISGLKVWDDFSLITTLWQDTAGTSQVSADGQSIKRIDDRSASAYNLTQVATPPTYKAAIKNGRSVGRFDGTDDKLIGNGALNLGTSHTISIACNPTSITADDILLGCSEASRPISIQSSGNAQTQYFVGAVVASFTIIGTGWQVITMRRSGTTVSLFVNGTQVGTDQTLSSNDTLNETLNLSGYLAGFFMFTGDVGEMTIYDSALSTANRVLLETYLLARWT